MRKMSVLSTSFHDLVGVTLITLSVLLFPLPGPSVPLFVGGLVTIYGKEKTEHIVDDWKHKGMRFFHL